MDIAGRYLQRHAPGEGMIREKPADDLKFIVVIPAFSESGLHHSLDSLFHAHLPDHSVEILVVINWPENADQEIRKNNLAIYDHYRQKYAWRKGDRIRCHFQLAGPLPSRFAGAGMARKIGMDEAIRRFMKAGRKDGIILSLDADTLCKPDYFSAVSRHFENNPSINGCNIRFEHPLAGNEFVPEVYLGVTFYELYMRYYLHGLRKTGHPNVFHTVGSAFAVREESYCRQGGMNRKKAGEDFYFLQKLFDEGHFSECKDTVVNPSPRPSERVVFGTGPSVQEYLRTREEPLTFHPQSFKPIGEFLRNAGLLFRPGKNQYEKFLKKQDMLMQDFLGMNDFEKIVWEMNANAASQATFQKRLLRWFNMFRMLKFLNFSKTQIDPVPVTFAAKELLKDEGLAGLPIDPAKLLKRYRDLELMS